MFDTDLIKKEFRGHWEKNGFMWSSAISVISRGNWCTTLFVNSGLAKYLEIVERENKFSSSMAGCQPCIKLASSGFSLEEMSILDGYFTFFEQLTCGGAEDVSLSWFIGRIWEYFVGVIKLIPEKISVGVPITHPELKDYWANAGLPIRNIVFPDQKAPFLSLHGDEIRGNYSSIYYDRTENCPTACRNIQCNVNCTCGRFLEIGDVGVVYSGKIRILDHGIGLERIAAIQKNLPHVTDIDYFARAMQVLNNKPKSWIIADYMRSIAVLIASGLKPGKKGRQHILRRLIRRILTYTTISEISSKHLSRLVKTSIRMLSLPRLEKKSIYQMVKSTIEEESAAFNKTINIGMRKLNRIISPSREVIPGEDAFKMYDAHGIPIEFIKKFASERGLQVDEKGFKDRLEKQRRQTTKKVI